MASSTPYANAVSSTVIRMNPKITAIVAVVPFPFSRISGMTSLTITNSS
jgi:uncharacterized protein (DUF697 family)